KLHLRLHAGGAYHPKRRRLLDEVLQKRRLANAGLATQHERSAFAGADGLNEPVEHVAFVAPARQRGCAAANWGGLGHLCRSSDVIRVPTGCDDWPMGDAIAPRRVSFSEVVRKEDARMTTVEQPGRFATLPDEGTVAATVVALEEHGFSVEAVDDLDAAREAVL